MCGEFAAESHVDRSIDNPNIFLKTNVIGTALLNASLLVFENNKEFLFHHISTDEVYGSLSFEDKPFKETNRIFQTALIPHQKHPLIILSEPGIIHMVFQQHYQIVQIIMAHFNILKNLYHLLSNK